MIEDLIARIASTEPPYTGDNLSGFTDDLECTLFDTDALTQTEVRCTDNLLCMLAVSTVVTDQADSLSSIEDTLHNVWLHACLPFFQATSCTRCKEAIVLRFVTLASGGLPFVSGVIVASGKHLTGLLAEYERTFDYGLSLPQVPRWIAELMN